MFFFKYFLYNDFFAAYVFYLPFVCIVSLYHLSCLTGILREFILTCKMVWNVFILASAEPFFYLLGDLHVNLASLHNQGTVNSPYQIYDYMHHSFCISLAFPNTTILVRTYIHIYFPCVAVLKF